MQDKQQKIAKFSYFENHEKFRECYVLETFDENGENEGIVAIYRFNGGNIPYAALIKSIELQRLGYLLCI